MIVKRRSGRPSTTAEEVACITCPEGGGRETMGRSKDHLEVGSNKKEVTSHYAPCPD
jgi:hypothetical protein